MAHIDVVLVVGVAIVPGLALGGPWRRWLVAAAAVAVSFAFPAGSPAAAACVLPWVGAAALGLLDRRDLVAAYGLVAALACLSSRLGWALLGVDEPFVLLTAVHYLFAGCGALALSTATRSRLAIVATAAAPPVVAAGFVTSWAVFQVGGAVVLAVGACATAAFELRDAGRTSDRRVVALLRLSGLAVWLPMGLAVAWALAGYVDMPRLSVPAMAATHGIANALGFTIAGLLGRRLSVPHHPNPRSEGPPERSFRPRVRIDRRPTLEVQP